MYTLFILSVVGFLFQASSDEEAIVFNDDGEYICGLQSKYGIYEVIEYENQTLFICLNTVQDMWGFYDTDGNMWSGYYDAYVYIDESDLLIGYSVPARSAIPHLKVT